MRKARLLAEHTGYYHVILKATGPQFLFQEDADKRVFQDILESSARFSGVGVLAFALLDNHFHLLVRVPDSRNGGTDSATGEGSDSLAAAFDVWMAEAEAVSREKVLGKIERGESLSPAEMLVCRIHAFSNGLALGSRESLESVPLPEKRITPIAPGDRLCTATRLRGTMFRVFLRVSA